MRSKKALRRSVVASALGSVAAFAALAAATPAQAARWEQISRGNGGQGAALFSDRSIPVFASDTGNFAMFQQEALLNGYDRSRRAPTKLRNVVDNTTRTVGAPVSNGFRYGNSELVHDVTDDEKTMLMSAPNPSSAGGNTSYKWFLRPVTGGPDIPIATTGYSDEYVEDGAISGDGSTVAISADSYPDDDLKVIDVASGSMTTYPSVAARLTISDDGKVIAGSHGCCAPGGFTIVDGMFARQPWYVTVSPDGSTLVLPNESYQDPTTSVEVRKVRTGTTRTFAAPAGGVGRLLWVSPDGNRIAFAGATSGAEAKYLNATTGVWAKFGREFSTSLAADSRVSRNGRYAVVEYARTNVSYSFITVGQAALVDLTGNDLPGSTEALSASSYFRVTPPLRSDCAADGTMRASYGRPVAWGPLPRRGELTVTVDGVQAFHGVYRDPTAADIEIPFSKDAKSVTTKVNVTDYVGRKLTTEQTIAVQCFFDLP